MTGKNVLFPFSLHYRAAFPCSCLHGVGTRPTYIGGQISIPTVLCIISLRRVKDQKMIYKMKTDPFRLLGARFFAGCAVRCVLGSAPEQ